MAEDSFEVEPAIVLCHTFFHDAFRTYPVFKIENIQNMISTQFIARFIIERQSELQEGQFFSFTSKKAFDDFKEKFELEDVKGGWKTEMVEVLDNMIYVVNNEGVNKLDCDESVFAISDIISSRTTRRPVILVSNMPSKEEKALAFYRKTDSRLKELPFEVYTAEALVGYLKGKYPEICKMVESRIRIA